MKTETHHPQKVSAIDIFVCEWRWNENCLLYLVLTKQTFTRANILHFYWVKIQKTNVKLDKFFRQLYKLKNWGSWIASSGIKAASCGINSQFSRVSFYLYFFLCLGLKTRAINLSPGGWCQRECVENKGLFGLMSFMGFSFYQLFGGSGCELRLTV